MFLYPRGDKRNGILAGNHMVKYKCQRRRQVWLGSKQMKQKIPYDHVRQEEILTFEEKSSYEIAK